MKTPRAPAIVAVAALIAIVLYSAFVINALLAANAPPVVAFSLGTAYRNITYCNSELLDLFIPSISPYRPLPLAIFVHGGGLTAGDKGDLNPNFLNDLASAGYAVASVNYHLAPLYKFPVQIQDVKCAIRFLRDNANKYGINESEFFMFGTSSGGELVALAALTGGYSSFDVGPYLNVSSSVTAVVDMFGPADLTRVSGYSPDDVLRAFGSNMTDEILASPTHFVTPNAPPILIIQGANDTNVPPAQSVELYNDLSAASDTTQLVMVRNMGHMFAQVGPQPIDPSLAQIAQDMVSFFGKYLGGASG